MLLSIIVPVYNVEKYLDDCISSLFRQGLDITDFEVLLIDDGSTDSSLLISQEWARQYKNIQVFHQNNQGQAVARNKGLDLASGQYLMFIDSDDYIYENSLPAVIDILLTTKCDCVNYGIAVENKYGVSVKDNIEGLEYNHIYTGEQAILGFGVFGSVCRYIFSSEIFKANGLRFKPGIAHEDCELCFRLFPLIKTIVFVEKVVYHYRYNQTSTDRACDRSSLRKRYNSDLIIAAELRKLIHTDPNLSELIKKRYSKIANSMITAHYLAYHNNPDLFATRNDYYAYLKELRLYPIKGRCNSILSTIISRLINILVFFSRF